MKVGIITYHHTTNYGATLQAFALGQYIKKLGHEIEYIDYRPIKAVITYFKSLYLNTSALDNYIKNKKMTQFVRKEMNLSKKAIYINNKSDSLFRGYDIVICGSDEIWNIESFRGFDSTYFIDGGNVPVKSSYAASVGYINSFGNNIEKIRQYLHEFKNISVRDNNTLQILQKECGLNAVKVLDPTFLGEYEKFTKNPIKQKYILIYGILNENESGAIKKIADEEKISIVSIGYKNKIADTNLISASPYDFLNYIKYANYVFTNFYHGVLFSLIFQKQFYALKRKDKMNKVSDILEELNLTDRIIDMTLDSINNKAISYEIVEEQINKRKKISEEYLWSVLA